MKRDPLLVLTALMAALAGGALAATGQVTVIALAVPAAAILAVLRPAKAPRGRLFETAFQVLALAFLAYFAWSVSNGRILGGAAALTIPVQIHSLIGMTTHRSLRRLHVLCFFQLVALAASTTGILFGPLLAVQLALSPLVLTLSALERAAGEPRRPIPWSRGLAWPATSAASLCLAGGIVGFLVLPRYEYGIMNTLSHPAERMGGFSDRVKLGDISRILMSDKVVMHVALAGARPPDLRWRGKVFDSFSGSEWSVTSEPRPVPPGMGGVRVGIERTGIPSVVQDFALEPLQERALFHVGRPTLVSPDTFSAVTLDAWGNLARGGSSSRRIRYRIVSQPASSGEDLTAAARAAFLQLPELDPRVLDLARRAAGEGDDGLRAARLATHLQEGWEYTLDVNDVGVARPVERFLLDKSAGHCEYFATGMVMLLREIGIPARLVTGFQEGTYSRFFSSHVVRQRDAHAWVEAWIPGSGWTTFDPTPPEGREVARTSDAVEIWRQIELLWDDNVVGFNYTFQLGFLVSAKEVIDAVAGRLRESGWPIAFAVAGACAAAGLLVLRRRIRLSPRARRADVAFYAAAQRLLERRGWRREPGQTPLEIARRAASATGGADAAGGAGEAVLELTRLYYAARFGGHAADASRVRRLLVAMQALPRRR